MKDVLLFGECLQLITAIPDESVDMVLCDLPYGVLNKGNLGAKWDCVIPFEPLWTQYKRICKEHAAIILFGSGMFTAKLMMSQPKLWRYNLVWDKVTTTGFLNCNRMPLRQHEDILVFYKKLPVFHPQMREGEWHTRQHGNDKNNCYGDFVMKPRVHSNMFYPTSILRFSKADSIRNGYHPTEKPVELCRYLIRQYSETGGVVLDNTMGSGTTCVAAFMENRHYIGIEKEQAYYNIAKRRIEEARRLSVQQKSCSLHHK